MRKNTKAKVEKTEDELSNTDGDWLLELVGLAKNFIHFVIGRLLLLLFNLVTTRNMGLLSAKDVNPFLLTERKSNYE